MLSAELIDRLLYYASRAPSPHNAQGWRVEVDGSRFRVSLDPARQVLRELDPHGREGDIACGAAVTNLRVAADAFGLGTEVRWRPTEDAAADVLLLTETTPSGDIQGRRLRTLRDRAMNRSTYSSEPVPETVLERLRDIAAGCGLGLSVLTSKSSIDALADLATRAGVVKLTHEPTEAELYRLMRFSPRSAARHRDGLDLELFFMSAAAARTAELFLHPRAVRMDNQRRVAARIAAESEGRPLRSSPAVCLLYADSLGPDTYLHGGACLEELALEVTEAGLAMALHSAPVEVGLSHPDSPSESIRSDVRDAVPELRQELLAACGVSPEGVAIALFRLGSPTREPSRRSLRRRLEEPRGESEHYTEMTRRNQPSLSREDQAALRSVRVLVAGCGSIGGAAVVPLVRLGVERLVLCEPGEYELNNLNRQAADLGDIGRNKAEVQASHARAINPEVEVLVEPDGVTADNVDWLVGTTDLVIDGVDVTEPAGIIAKRQLHDEAWRQRRLVISGLDLGGTQLVYAFDYRDGRRKPLDGRFEGVDSVTPLEFLSRLVAALDVPREMLAYAEAMIKGGAGSPPQLAPAADQFGVLASWMVLDFAVGRPVRKRVKVAIPDLVMPRRLRMQSEALRMFELGRVKFLLETERRRARHAERNGHGDGDG